MSEILRILLLVFIVCFQACVSQLDDHFLDCEGNDRRRNPLRRCCESDQLPKGCECFDIYQGTDFTNTLFNLPECPADQDAIFYYYDKDHLTTSTKIRAGAENILETPFSGERNTVFVVHGFLDSGLNDWTLEMKDKLLAAEDLNVILVDWQEGAGTLNYYQAAANARTVGAMVGRLVQDLTVHAGAQFEKFHLVGHSLGAHIMGYAGKEVYRLTGQMVGRITGLDPAGPAFESHSHYVRLDALDGSFVDVLHTDGEHLLSSGFGTRYSIGHVDFYPNGGQHQPGCPEENLGIFSLLNFEDGQSTGYCSHNRAHEFFSHSISDCRYDPPTADGSVCTMGYHTDAACRGDYYPETTAEEPYC